MCVFPNSINSINSINNTFDAIHFQYRRNSFSDARSLIIIIYLGI